MAKKKLPTQQNLNVDEDAESERLRGELQLAKQQTEDLLDSLRGPGGDRSHAEASFYFTEYCEVMRQGVGNIEKESRLPTTIEEMKEAIKQECLNWCNHDGKDVDETFDFMASGYLQLAKFVPDEMAEAASLETSRNALENENIEAFKAAQQTSSATLDLVERKMEELNADWNDFRMKFRSKYP